MNKLVAPIKTVDGTAFCEIEIKDGKLSITGVVGPTRDGNCRGSCGQIDDTLREAIARNKFTLLDDWTQEQVDKFLEIWDRWHLNDMKAGNAAQETFLRYNRSLYAAQKADHYTWACAVLAEAGLHPDPETGYKYGSAWLKEELPGDVIEFLESLPKTTREYAWKRG